MGEPLKNPPLVEAVCEFRFDPASEWDWTVPGRLFDKIGDEFSERSEVRRLEVTVEQGGEKSPSPAVIETGPDRIQLKRPDGSAMVQVGPKLLAINHLRPYPNWETFRGLILRVYQTYCDIAGSSALDRIGLRYINQIPIPSAGRKINEMLTIQPKLSRSLDRPVTSFFQRYALEHENPKGGLIHQTGLQIVDGNPIVALDLDFFSKAVADIASVESMMDWLDQAHERVEEGFIDSLTPDFYERLKKGEE